MAYTLPTFNLTVNVWHAHDLTTGPPAGAPDVVPSCNLALARKYEGSGPFAMHCYLPPLTDVRKPDVTNVDLVDIAECPAGSGRWYVIWCVDDVGKGFANEYRVAGLYPADEWTSDGAWNWPTPIP